MLLGVIQNVHHSGRVIGSVDKSDKKGHRGRMCTQKVMPLTENCWGGRELKGWRRVASQKTPFCKRRVFWITPSITLYIHIILSFSLPYLFSALTLVRRWEAFVIEKASGWSHIPLQKLTKFSNFSLKSLKMKNNFVFSDLF